MRLGLLILCAFAVNQVHASRARLRAFNQDANGSFYVQDTRNMFLNPAFMSGQGESVQLDWGKQERTGTSTSAEAEGGYIQKMGNLNMGIQLGRVNDFSKDIRAYNAKLSDMTTAVNGGDFSEGQNNLDILFAGQSSMDWGAMLSVTRSKTATAVADKQAEVQAFEARGGVATKNFDGFVSLMLGAETVTEGAATDAELEQKFALLFGGGFAITPQQKIYARLRYATFDAKKKDNSVDYDGDDIEARIGFSRSKNMDKNARFFSAVELDFQKLDADDNKTTNVDEKYEVTSLPITLGIEADANSWLRLRGSVKQGILLGRTKSTAGVATGSKKWENSTTPQLRQEWARC